MQDPTSIMWKRSRLSALFFSTAKNVELVDFYIIPNIIEGVTSNTKISYLSCYFSIHEQNMNPPGFGKHASKSQSEAIDQCPRACL